MAVFKRKQSLAFLEFVIFLFSYEAAPESMVFFYFKTATDGFPGLWVRPLPGADKGSSQRRRNRESADRLTGGRADDHVRKEISFPSEKTEKKLSAPSSSLHKVQGRKLVSADGFF